MPTEVRDGAHSAHLLALLPIRTYAGPTPVAADQTGNPFVPTDWEDRRRLMADGGAGEFFLLDLTVCPLDREESVAASPQWHLPRASTPPDPPITLMTLDAALSSDLVVLAHVTDVLEQKPKYPRK